MRRRDSQVWDEQERDDADKREECRREAPDEVFALDIESLLSIMYGNKGGL